VIVGVMNKVFTGLIPQFYGKTHVAELPGLAKPVTTQVASVVGVWAVEGALVLGILSVIALAFGTIRDRFADGSKTAIAGSLLAALNTASEYGFGGVIAALPGFLLVADWLKAIPGVLFNEAVTVTALAGITGSASGGMSIALATMSDSFIAAADAAHVPLEVLHRIASMASGGMDTLPHNGAVITLLAVTGLTHKTSYMDIFAITIIKTLAVVVAIVMYSVTGIY
jgi:H+/gluconate symporter-like permease